MECFATLTAILSSVYPDKALHFFAYLRTISKASRTFESTAWASYNMVFHRQAANRIGGLSMRPSTVRHLRVVPRWYPAVSIVWQIPTPPRTACMHLTHGAQEEARTPATQSSHGWGDQHLTRQVRCHGPLVSTSVDCSTPRVARASSSPYAGMHTCASGAGAHTLFLSVVQARGRVAQGPPHQTSPPPVSA